MVCRGKMAHRWIANSIMSLFIVLLFTACGTPATDRERILLQNGEDGTIAGTPTVSPHQAQTSSPTVSPFDTEAGNVDSGGNLAENPQLSVDATIPPDGTEGNSNQTTIGEDGKKETPPAQSPPAETKELEAEIIVRSGNILSSNEKEELLKELENELDGLFRAIDMVNIEPQPDLPE